MNIDAYVRWWCAENAAAARACVCVFVMHKNASDRVRFVCWHHPRAPTVWVPILFLSSGRKQKKGTCACAADNVSLVKNYHHSAILLSRQSVRTCMYIYRLCSIVYARTSSNERAHTRHVRVRLAVLVCVCVLNWRSAWHCAGCADDVVYERV